MVENKIDKTKQLIFITISFSFYKSKGKCYTLKKMILLFATYTAVKNNHYGLKSGLEQNPKKSKLI
jgi:hypothetical protein